MNRHRHLLPPRQVPWTLRPLSSATTSLGHDRHGRMVCRIEHRLLRGISPRHLVWWFCNIGGDMDLDGRSIAKYLAWHPVDHIHWELAAEAPGGGVGVGARFRIVEAFGGRIAHRIDVIEDVLRLDESGITLAGRRLGIEVSRLQHDFVATPEGTLYRSTLTIGTALPLLRSLVNPLIHRLAFPEAMGRAWLLHNVEEVGALEHLLPLLVPTTEQAHGARYSAASR